MPTLSWIGKDAAVNHRSEVPYRLLRDVPELGGGDPGSGNLLVEGDNLHALKALPKATFDLLMLRLLAKRRDVED